MEPENPHYDGGKPFIICKLSHKPDHPGGGEVFPGGGEVFPCRFSPTDSRGCGRFPLDSQRKTRGQNGFAIPFL